MSQKSDCSNTNGLGRQGGEIWNEAAKPTTPRQANISTPVSKEEETQNELPSTADGWRRDCGM